MIRLIRNIVIAALALGSTSVLAQTITVGSDSGTAGATVVIPVNFVAGATAVGSMDIDVDFDAAKFSDATGDCSVTNVGQALASCSEAAGKVRISIAGDGSNALTTGLAANISFTIADPVAAGGVDLDGVIFAASNVDGSAELPSDAITVNDGVLTIVGPAYTSDPTPAQGVDLGSVVQGGTDPTAPVLVTNTGAAGTTLTVTGCSITSNASLFSVDSEAQFTVDEGSAGVTRTVSCRASGAIQVHNGVMTCNHDGGAAGEATPADYALTCNITEGPQPTYSSNPAAGTPIALGPVEEGDPINDELVAISNSGDPDTLLTGTCDVTGHSQISVADGAFSVVQGGAPDIQTVSCDSSAEGNYAATLTCEHDGDNATATYAVTCSVGPAGGALFRSVPMSGSTTPIGVDVVMGDTPAPRSPLTFFNDADSGDMDLLIACAITSGDAAITVSPDISGGISIPAPGTDLVAFSCDTAAPGSFSATYSCDYTVDGTSLPAGTNGGVQQAIYTYTCDVRDRMSDVDPTPAAGTPLPIPIDSAGGTGTTMVVFEEVADENLSGELTLCSLAPGDNFQITDPALADFPVTIPAGGSVTVIVEGTDPDDGSSPTNILTCTYTDSANSDPGVTVTYPLSLEIGGGTSTFEVNKVFDDGNPGDVTVTLTCNSGLPLVQSFVISEGHGVNFVVAGIVSGATDCTVSEAPVSGYTGTYLAAGDSSSTSDSSGCHYESVESGASNTCRITNDPDPVDVVITKEWIYADSDAGDIPPDYVLTLYCDAVIEGGRPEINGGVDSPDSISDIWFKVFGGSGSAIFTAMVIPEYPSSHCWVDENVFSDAVETDNDCRNIEVSAGNGDSCTITNSVFFEGIPTLSQYGLAIMALLMLGMGLLGFRRFS
jgi:hypothetical protein